MVAATPAAVSRGRKRSRRQLSLAGADGTRSPTAGTFPRVATAPASLAPSSTAAATTRVGVSAKTRRPSSPAFGDTSELDAQISTLALIRAHGYGVVPGTPLLRDNKVSASAEGPRCRMAVHGARDLLKSSGTEGSSMTGCDAPAAIGKVVGGGKQAITRRKPGSTKPNRAPWMGPLDSRVSLTPKRLGLNAPSITNTPRKSLRVHSTFSYESTTLTSVFQLLSKHTCSTHLLWTMHAAQHTGRGRPKGRRTYHH